MTRMLVGLDEVLVRLKERGPLPTREIAHQFGLNSLDARILMLDAHLHGLVIRNDWDEWALSARGREAVNEREARPAPMDEAPAWRRGPRRVALAAACAVVCALIAAVPISLERFVGTGPQLSTQPHTTPVAASRLHRRAATARHHVSLFVSRGLEQRLRTRHYLRWEPRRPARRLRPSQTRAPGEDGAGASLAPGGGAVRVMSTNRALVASGGKSCAPTRSSIRWATAPQRPSRNRCSRPSRGTAGSGR